MPLLNKGDASANGSTWSESAKLAVAAAALGIGVAAAFFSTLGASPLIEPDEARYAEIAREMLVRGDWVTPTLNFVPYFEKPPLVYWLTTISLALFGQHDWAVRLWPALSGLVGVGCTARLAASMFGWPTGLLAGAILATTPLYFGMSQVLTLDMPLTAWCTASLVCAWFVLARVPGRPTIAVVVFWLALGLGVLTKGPVAVVLVLGTLVLYALAIGKPGVLVRLVWVPGIVLFLVVAVPWFVLLSWRHPEFVSFFFVEQHLARYARPWEHREPPWFYIPVLLAGTLPWCALSAWAMVRVPGKLTSVQLGREDLFLGLWFATVLLFFSVSGSKLATYILPALPPLAILFARFLGERLAPLGSKPYRVIGDAAWLLGLAVLGAARVVPIFSTHHRAQMLPAALVEGALLLLLGGLGLRLVASRWQGAPWALFAALVGLLWGIELVTFANRAVAEQYTPLAQAIRRQWAPGDRIVLYRHYTQGIPYYTGQRVVVVGAWGELDFGSRYDPQGEFFWKSEGRLVEEWRKSQRMFLVINAADLRALEDRLEPKPRAIARWGKKLVVVNF
ncbi:MAG: glycosyl transferase [Candidatus Binatia bacterium]|nr:MAG: glycosyl transferase [Candidatus Binatia bacterium]